MPITYPITLPSTPGPVSIKWSPISVVNEQESPFSLVSKVYAWSGQKRYVTVQLPPLNIDQAKEWSTFPYQLNGIEGTFYLRDEIGKYLRGFASGVGRVKGANQTGIDLITDGWLPFTLDLFKRGDWIQVGSRLHTVLKDVDSSSTGEATLTLWPRIRTAPADNLVIPYGEDAIGIFRLVSFPEYGWDVDLLMNGFAFQAKEAI